jgi:hypothetical protein
MASPRPLAGSGENVRACPDRPEVTDCKTVISESVSLDVTDGVSDLGEKRQETEMVRGPLRITTYDNRFCATDKRNATTGGNACRPDRSREAVKRPGYTGLASNRPGNEPN